MHILKKCCKWVQNNFIKNILNKYININTTLNNYVNNTQYWTNCFKHNKTVGLYPSVQLEMSDVAISNIFMPNFTDDPDIHGALLQNKKVFI